MKKRIKRVVGICLAVSFFMGVFTFGEGRTGIALAEEVKPSNPVTKAIVNSKGDSDLSTAWSCVWFGNYWQNDTNEDGIADTVDSKEPLKWRVLSVNGDDALLLADECIDAKEYNSKAAEVTWETCSLRKWLNEDFIENAFNDEEKKAIKEVEIVNGNNPESGTEGGANTTDKVFLLSFDEVVNSSYGFTDNKDAGSLTRRAGVTDFAECNGGDRKSGNGGAGAWWLRTPGDTSDGAMDVDDEGSVGSNYSVVDTMNLLVRPALHLNLAESSWSAAQKVYSDDEGETVVVDETVYSIGRDSTASVKKSGNNSVKKLVLPDTIEVDGREYKVTKIGKNAFSNSKKLKEVVCGKNIEIIEKSAFKKCKNLKKVVFPSKLKRVEASAFENCKKLKKTNLPRTLTKIGKNCFKNCKKLKLFTVGKGGKFAKKKQETLNLLIDSGALENCPSLKKIIINCQVRVIGNSAFSRCKNLDDIIIYSVRLKTVGKKALKGVHDCDISVPIAKVKPYKTLFKNKGQGKKVVVVKL